MTDLLVRTRLALHGAAEMLVAGPQYRRTGKIGLRIQDGGFASTREPVVAVLGRQLVVAGRSFPLEGTYRDVADAAGLTGAGPLRDVYTGSPSFSLDDEIAIDPHSQDKIAAAYELGNAALSTLVAGQAPILWPEHFDVAVSIDSVNYGVSPGDAGIPAPYAYVGPYVARRGDFWNAAFGSARLMNTFADLDALLGYFRDGQRHAQADPPASERNA
jgi:hypothetical protein